MTSSAFTYKDIQLIVKEEFSMKRLPRQLNVFFFFLSRYILSKNEKMKRKYDASYMIESTIDENFYASNLCLAWISKNKLKELGVQYEVYKPWFDKFTRLHSGKTFTRCERFQWKPEAHRFFERFLDLDIPEYDEFKILLRTKKDKNS